MASRRPASATSRPLAALDRVRPVETTVEVSHPGMDADSVDGAAVRRTEQRRR